MKFKMSEKNNKSYETSNHLKLYLKIFENSKSVFN